MIRIRWSAEALDDFDRAIAYIAREDRRAAVAVADGIDLTVRNLASVASGHPGRVSGTYEKLVPRLPYIVAYALRASDAGEHELVVLRVVHASRDWPEGGWPQGG